MSRASLTLLVSLSLGLGLTACGDDSSPGGGGETDTDATTGPTTGPTTDTPTSDGPTTDTPTTDASSTTDPTVADTGSETTDPSVGETEGDTETTGVTGDGTYFRINSLQVRDPHVFNPISSADVTEEQVNGPLNIALNTDEDDDGNLDLGLVLGALPLDQSDAATEVLRFANATCTAPAETASCSLLAETIAFDGVYSVTSEGECYAADPANLSDFADPPTGPEPTTGPCFRSDIGTVSIAAGSFTLPLENAVVSAQFVGDPADGLVQGNIEGFVSTGTAMSVQVQRGLTVPLATLLRDEDQDEGGTGWVFHISFEATLADWTE